MTTRTRPGRLRIGWAASALLIAGCLPAPGTIGLRQPSFAELVDSATSVPPLHRTHWGIEVYDPDRGETLYALNAERHFIPASNAKLVVTVVAMGELGPEWRYRTELYAPRAGPADTVAQALVVVGRGDPTLSARFHPTAFAPFDSLADSVALAGVRRVAGELVVDVSYFDRTAVHPSWEVGDLPYAYAAPVSAFAVAEASLEVVVSPGAQVGQPARVELLGPQVLAVQNQVTTAVPDTTRAYEAVFVGMDTLVLAGRIPLGRRPDTVRLALPDPAVYAGRALRAALEARGIEVEGEVRIVQDSIEARLLRAGAPAPIATWTSPPLSEIVAAILQPSQNWIAEQLLKTLGAERAGEGSWAAGLTVERRYLTEVVGIDSSAFVLRDASGLSAQNLLTPHAAVQLLDHARRAPWGDRYRVALAQPGIEGTLKTRFTGLEGRIFAKTGTITHVNTLSGYVHTSDGRELIFSVMTNASGRPAAEVRRTIDRLVTVLAEQGVRE